MRHPTVSAVALFWTLAVLAGAAIAHAQTSPGGPFLGDAANPSIGQPSVLETVPGGLALGGEASPASVMGSYAGGDTGYGGDWTDNNYAANNYAANNYAMGGLCPQCETCPSLGVYGFVGYDSFRGVQDDGWGNNGVSTGLNFGTRLGRFSDWTGVGFQLGGSVGVFNFNGTDFHLTRNDQATMQGFVTYGFFRKANDQSNWSAAVVQDWMITSNYGVFAENPTLAQWRGQVGYALGPWNELGVWGTWVGQGDSRVVNFFGPTQWRPVQQLNPYWHYKWGPGGADTWLWFGVPEHTRLAGNGSLGDYTVGALANCPLGNRVMLYALVTYMHPSSAPGPTGAADEAWNFTIGLSFFPAANARTRTVAGQCWMPQLPVANNGYFLVDTNRGY